MNSANENVDIVNVRDINLVFFPILLHGGIHYFCVVFNLKTNMIDILDNIHWIGSLYVHHLRNINHHPSAKILATIEPRVVEMKWRTKANYVDYWVFLMRHMETYMGGGSRGWFTGLPTEAEGHKKALQTLIIKYTWKLLGKHNQFKNAIKHEIDNMVMKLSIRSF
ncbi:hypothetical protein OSB04_010639 [Centaurea solstitialis]|uniref:Ubiquitin-like protease family profile domain-containing protein n=1 Tax=Centaurea solstitialis TaxID=347529 RepID=A0AA38WKU5_9ASTR|nr:hypothetical protein OSB04_010639 [Centaurea solstitialis]